MYLCGEIFRSTYHKEPKTTANNEARNQENNQF